MASKNILLITYYWPPSGGVGVQRWMNFALQLKKRGWNPIVLTPENPQFEIKDETLLDKVGAIPVYKVSIWEPFDLFHAITGQKNRKNVQQGLAMEKSKKTVFDALTVWVRGNLFIPDPRVFWLNRSSKVAMDLIRTNNITHVISTGPPHSMHLIGRRIKRKLAHIKWIADFRDPWSKWDVLEKLNTSPLALWVHKQMEQSVLEEADKVLTVSDRLASSLGNAQVLNNGVTVEVKNKTVHRDTKFFTIGYYGLLNELRNPSQLWLVLDQMCRENEAFASKLRIRIGGIIAESVKDELIRLDNLKDRVEFLGYLSHDTLMDEYKKCNILLLLLNKSANSKWILPIKFFEYLAAGRMVLSLGERDSDLGELMQNRDIGEIMSYSEISQIRAFIHDVFENNIEPSQKDLNDLVDHFSHETLTKKLEEILLEIDD